MLRQILSTIRLRVLALLHRKRLDQDLEDELAFHLAMREEEQRASGVDPETARFAARKRFGNVVALKEACRELWTFRPLEQLAQDVRYALRMLRRDPGFTTVAVLTLALGIGATTAVFALLDAALLRRLPVAEPERLVVPHWIAERTNVEAATSVGCDEPGNCVLPFPIYERLRDEARSFSGFAAFSGRQEVQVASGGQVSLAEAQLVTGNFLSVLGVRPEYGRILTPSDDSGVGEPVVVLSDAYWRKRFGGDPAVIGQTMVVNGTVLTVVGITPAGFFGLDPSEPLALWIPLHTATRIESVAFIDPRRLLDEHSFVLGTVARLGPGVDATQARAELAHHFRQVVHGSPVFDLSGGADVVLESVARGMNALQAGYRGPLRVLTLLVGVVLAVACANIAALLLARAVARRGEIALRLAIGAGRRRLVMQLLTEGLVLSVLGGAGGLALGFWGSRLLALSLNPDMQKEALTWARPSASLLALTMAVVSITTVVFALVPAWAARRVEPARDLQPARAVGKGTRIAGRRANHVARWIVAGEVAGTLVLLVGAGLFVRTVVNYVTFDPGFRTDHLLTVAVSPVIGSADSPAVSADIVALQERLSHLPGVERATWSNYPILGEGTTFGIVFLEPGKVADVARFQVGPQFFGTMGMRLVAGRDVEADDFRPGASTAWIDRSLADLHFSGLRSVGTSIEVEYGIKREIAGVVEGTSLGWVQMPRKATVYVPSQDEIRYLVLRTRVAPLSLSRAVEDAAHEVAPHLFVRSMKDEAEYLEQGTRQERLLAASSLALGGLTLLLAAVGLYGVLSYSVSRRTGEIAIRMSLGAVRADILRLVLGEGSRVVLLGAVFGAVGAYWTSRSFSHFLFGVRPVDPLSYGVATLVLLAVAALASYVPASRASRIDPATALRAE